MRLDEGTLCGLLTRSGDRAGFLFEGRGRLRYASEDEGDRQTFGINVAAFTDASALVDGVFGADIRRGAVFTSRPLPRHARPATEGSVQGPVPRPAPRGFEALLAARIAAMDEADFGPGHAAAREQLGPATAEPSESVPVYAEFEGRGPTVGYLLDRIAGEERLLLYRTLRGDRFARVVSRQALPGGRAGTPIQLTDLDVAFDTEDNRTATLRLVQTFSVLRDWGRLLPLELANHDDPAASNWHSSSRGIEVISVRDAAGTPLPFSHRYHELLVEWPAPLRAGEQVTLRVELSLRDVRPPAQGWMWLGTWAWFPRPQWEGSVRARCHFRARTAKPWRPIAPGALVGLTEEAGHVVLETRLDVPVNFPTLFAGPGRLSRLERNGRAILVHQSGPGAGESDAARRAALAADLLDTFGTRLGPYPLAELNIVDLHGSGLWRSPAGVVVISGEAPSDGAAAVASWPRAGAGDWMPFAHEIAHQWWGDLVAPRSFLEDDWISESLAEYFAGLSWWESASDTAERALRRRGCLARWRAMAEASDIGVSLSRASFLRGDGNESHRRNLLYGRGPLVVHMLHETLGERAFDRLVAGLVRDHGGATLGTVEVARAATEAAGVEMDWFFRQWVAQPGIPRVRVEMTPVEEPDGLVLTGSLRQDPDERFTPKRLRVPIVYDLPDGLSGSVVVPFEGDAREFRVHVPAVARNFRADPERVTLVRYH